MVKINNSATVGFFAAGLFFILPALCNAQIALDRLFTEKSIINSDNQAKKSEDKRISITKNKTDVKSENKMPLTQTQKDAQEEDEQDMMEKALDLLEVADNYWEKGDVENTLNILDKAYALILDTNGDPAVAREKDDLRLLISKRILAAYSSKQTVTNGIASEIPLIMNPDVEKEIRSFQGYERDFFISSYQRSGMYRPIMIRELKKAGIPEELSWLPLVESGFKILALSRARALGLWQFIPSTGYKFGLSRDEWIDERMDVEKSTEAAIAYLKELHGMFGDWLTVLAAYNCGEGRVLRVISRQHINYFDRFWDLYRQLPNETARYVPRFLATLHIIRDPKKYGMNLGADIEKPIAYEFVKVNKIMKLQDIAAKIEVPEETLNLLNSELRYRITPDKEYDLKVPVDYVSKFKLVVAEIPESEKPRLAAAAGRGRMVLAKHRVKQGETIASIAKRYKISPSTIASYNNISTKKRLVVGQVLRVPVIQVTRIVKNKSDVKSSKNRSTLAEANQQYKVKKGDTLLNIAKRFDVSVPQLKKMNNLKSNSIRIGQVLKVTKADADNVSEGKSNSDKKNG
ncbi:MAG: lytic transglycosylase [Deltaproteobacteria bacterium HGW-Deltaproteobacteria-12]|jgi:membrane-bound lytic murein transglycosylase D|nr:MAG: lytic transglycosylase [Deltaproteobacteria bacterium HGW-Deltaproteobacteria-12]